MTASIEPFFLPSYAGNIFCVYFPPNIATDTGKDLLFFPPFAEELNKSRRMVSLQARALSRLGFGVLIPDLYGTGDSEGDFADGEWELWMHDLESAHQWLTSRGRDHVIYWGMRLGALLALDAVSRWRVAPLKIVLWQAVVSGETYLTHFLRLRLAADMVTSGGAWTIESMRAALSDGNQVEVAGYILNPSLAASIDKLSLAAFRPPPDVPVEWLEVVSAPDRPISHAGRQMVDRWRQDAVTIKVSTVVGEVFWNTPEISQLPNLIEITVQRVIV